MPQEPSSHLLSQRFSGNRLLLCLLIFFFFLSHVDWGLFSLMPLKGSSNIISAYSPRQEHSSQDATFSPAVRRAGWRAVCGGGECINQRHAPGKEDEKKMFWPAWLWHFIPGVVPSSLNCSRLGSFPSKSFRMAEHAALGKKTIAVKDS